MEKVLYCWLESDRKKIIPAVIEGAQIKLRLKGSALSSSILFAFDEHARQILKLKVYQDGDFKVLSTQSLELERSKLIHKTLTDLLLLEMSEKRRETRRVPKTKKSVLVGGVAMEMVDISSTGIGLAGEGIHFKKGERIAIEQIDGKKMSAPILGEIMHSKIIRKRNHVGVKFID